MKSRDVRVQDNIKFLSLPLLLVCATTLLLFVPPACLLLPHPMTWTFRPVSLYIYACVFTQSSNSAITTTTTIYYHYYYYYRHHHRHHHHPTPPLLHSCVRIRLIPPIFRILIKTRLIHYGPFFLVFFLGFIYTHIPLLVTSLHAAHTHILHCLYLTSSSHYLICHYERGSLWK